MKNPPKAPFHKTPPGQSKLQPFESMILTARLDKVCYRSIRKRLLGLGTKISLGALQSFCKVRVRRAKNEKHLKAFLILQQQSQMGGLCPIAKESSKEKTGWKFDLNAINLESNK